CRAGWTVSGVDGSEVNFFGKPVAGIRVLCSKESQMKLAFAVLLLVVPCFAASCDDARVEARRMRAEIRRETADLRREAFHLRMDAHREAMEARREARREAREAREEAQRETRELRRSFRAW